MKYIVTVTDEGGVVLARSERPVAGLDLDFEVGEITREARDLIRATGRDEDDPDEPEP